MHPGCNPTRAVQVIGAEDDATELLTVRSPLSPSASPLSPSASWPGVTARHVRIWMISPAAALRDTPTSLGYSILEVRACAHPAVQPGVPTGRCAAAAEAKGLHVFHFEVCTCTLYTACACALHTHCRCMCMCMHTAGACACTLHEHCMCTCRACTLHMHCMCVCTAYALHVHVACALHIHCAHAPQGDGAAAQCVDCGRRAGGGGAATGGAADSPERSRPRAGRASRAQRWRLPNLRGGQGGGGGHQRGGAGRLHGTVAIGGGEPERRKVAEAGAHHQRRRHSVGDAAGGRAAGLGHSPNPKPNCPARVL